ncbi:MAG: hypothetical protein JSW03_00955 [Candidatus Eiseniibacteriota bacterium]|nr:MAG: hypothetical protein JSW03_00955 [Candidatus Eisenbacteria bacterium]
MSNEKEALPARNPDGTYIKGVSGNPAGRPKGRKNVITGLKQDLEIAVREAVDPRQIKAVVSKMVELALEGNVGAGKLILDKVLSNAKEGEDEKETSGGLKIVIEHANMEGFLTKQNIIDVKAEEVEE